MSKDTTELERIVRDIAENDAAMVELSCSYACDRYYCCAYCDGEAKEEGTEDDFKHKENCVWLRSKAWVAKAESST